MSNRALRTNTKYKESATDKPVVLSLLLNEIVLKMEDYKKQLSEVKAVEFRGTKLNVKFPNVGEMIDIENLKTAYSRGRYGVMLASGVKSMIYAVDVIDAMAFIEIKLKAVRNMLNLPDGQSLMSVDSGLASELTAWYKQQIAPWYNSMMSKLYEAGNAQPSLNEQTGADA